MGLGSSRCLVLQVEMDMTRLLRTLREREEVRRALPSSPSPHIYWPYTYWPVQERSGSPHPPPTRACPLHLSVGGQVLNQLAAGEAAPSLSSRPAAMPLLPSEAEPPPTADLGHGDERPLQLSTQQQELLLPATDAQPSPPRSVVNQPAPLCVCVRLKQLFMP